VADGSQPATVRKLDYQTSRVFVHPALILGSETLGSETLGSETLGSETLGSETLGSETLGSEALGSEALGSETLGSATRSQRCRARGCWIGRSRSDWEHTLAQIGAAMAVSGGVLAA
jgi:hypothetical protein